jgi:hypothetical protein
MFVRILLVHVVVDATASMTCEQPWLYFDDEQYR